MTLHVLHLIEPGGPGGDACTVRLLSDLIGRLDSVGHEVLVIGARRHAELARRCGLEASEQVCPPRAWPPAAGRTVRRFITARRGGGRKFHLIHAWTPRCALAAAIAAPRLPRLLSLHAAPQPGLVMRGLLLQQRRGPLRVLAASPAIERHCRTMGFRREALSILPPAVEVDSKDLLDRAAVRQRWKVDLGIDEQTFVVGLLGEPAGEVDARQAAVIAARVVLSGRRIRLFMHHSAAQRVQAQRFMREVGMPEAIVLDDGMLEPWRVAAGLDVALIRSGVDRNPSRCKQNGSIVPGAARFSQSILPLLWACAAASPIVLEPFDAVGEVIENGISGRLVNAGDLNAASDAIASVFDDRRQASAMGAAARSAVMETFNMQGYCERLKYAYDLLLADPMARTA